MDRQEYKARTRALLAKDQSFVGDCGAYFNRIDYANGYAASVVSHRASYGGSEGEFEVAVLDGETGRLIYDTPITSDVLGFLDFAGVAEVLRQIASLPRRGFTHTCQHCGEDTPAHAIGKEEA